METPKSEELLPKPLEEIPAHTTSPNIPRHEVRTLLSWTAPGRPFKKRGKQFYLTALLIAFLIEVILFLFSEYTLMLVVASLVFVSFAFAYVPPKNFHYRISTEGVMVEDHFYIWRELYDFYFTKRQGQEILNIRSQSIFPGVITISLGELHKDEVKNALVAYLPYREYVKPGFMERSGDWLSKNFPLEPHKV